MIIMFLISLAVAILILPNLKVKQRSRKNILDNWPNEWEYLGRFKLPVWSIILIAFTILTPILNIVASLALLIYICFPTECWENTYDSGFDYTERIIYLDGGLINRFKRFLYKEI